MKKQITIKLKTLLLIAIAIAMIISIPLQFIVFLIFKKNILLRFFENQFCKISFQITDIKRSINQHNRNNGS